VAEQLTVVEDYKAVVSECTPEQMKVLGVVLQGPATDLREARHSSGEVVQLPCQAVRQTRLLLNLDLAQTLTSM